MQARERKIGLARAISKLGYCSRSRATELIREGRVKLNAAVRRDPETPVRMSRDRIAVDENAIGAARKIYLAMNKPRGIMTTAADEKGRDTVYSLLPAGMKWLAPVGRLDKASEGLLLFTNDSEWGARVAAPDTHLAKKYHVQVKGAVSASMCEQLQRGVRVETGEVLRSESAEIVRSGGQNTWLQIVLTEGKNRQIRRMLESLGIETLRLVRISIGPLELGTLPNGGWRELSSAETSALDLAISGRMRSKI